jgi:hypothetical protein
MIRLRIIRKYPYLRNGLGGRDHGITNQIPVENLTLRQGLLFGQRERSRALGIGTRMGKDCFSVARGITFLTGLETGRNRR